MNTLEKKSIINNDMKFFTSQTSYFYLKDLEKNTWQYYPNGKASCFHVHGNPKIHLNDVDNNLLNDYASSLSKLGIEMIEVFGFYKLLQTDTICKKKHMDLLSRCIKDFEDVNFFLDMYNARIPEEIIKHYIRSNAL